MSARVAVLDIERLPGTFAAEFWDLNDYKGRRIHADAVTEWPRTICAAWRWRGEKKMNFSAVWEWSDPAAGPTGLAQDLHRVYDEADVVVGHNIDGFDTKKIASDWLQAGFSPPSPWKSIDTLKVARQRFGYESNTLNALCERLGISAKTDRYDARVARAACEGNVAAQRRIKRYNQGDIVATEALYERLMGWQKNPPNASLWINDEEVHCIACGGTDLQLRGEQVALSQTYDRVQCQNPNCGKWQRGVDIVRRVGGTRNA